MLEQRQEPEVTTATSCLPHTVSAEHGAGGRCGHCVTTPIPGCCASPRHVVHLLYLSLCIIPVSDCTLPHVMLFIFSISSCCASPPCQVVRHPMPGAACRGFPASPCSAQVHPNQVPSFSPFLRSHCPNPAPCRVLLPVSTVVCHFASGCYGL